MGIKQREAPCACSCCWSHTQTVGHMLSCAVLRCAALSLVCRFHTPLFFSDGQLQELSGTTLAAATAARKAALSRSWQQLKPAVQQMLQQVRRMRTIGWLDWRRGWGAWAACVRKAAMSNVWTPLELKPVVQQEVTASQAHAQTRVRGVAERQLWPEAGSS